MTMINIRSFEAQDWAASWRIIEPVFRAGETFPLSPDVTREEAYEYWVATPSATFVATDEDRNILGSYYIRPNQPALGSHVCNCGYIVDEGCRGKGIASAMGEHSLREAVELGFRAMQFNLVVATNEPSLYLWKKLGFEVVGRLPGAFRHRRHGFVDAFVMYKQLVE